MFLIILLKYEDGVNLEVGQGMASFTLQLAKARPERRVHLETISAQHVRTLSSYLSPIEWLAGYSHRPTHTVPTTCIYRAPHEGSATLEAHPVQVCLSSRPLPRSTSIQILQSIIILLLVRKVS